MQKHKVIKNQSKRDGSCKTTFSAHEIKKKKKNISNIKDISTENMMSHLSLQPSAVGFSAVACSVDRNQDSWDLMLQLRHCCRLTGRRLRAASFGQVIDGRRENPPPRGGLYIFNCQQGYFAVWRPGCGPKVTQRHTNTIAPLQASHACADVHAQRLHTQMQMWAIAACDSQAPGIKCERWRPFQSLWLIVKLSLANSYGWVPAYKMTIHHFTAMVNLWRRDAPQRHSYLTCLLVLMLRRFNVATHNAVARSSMKARYCPGRK